MKTLPVLAMLLPLAGHAAPFCIDMTGIALQCQYFDPALCQKDAARQGGKCSPNPEEFKTPASAQQFCLVQSGNLVMCHYPDRAGCELEANRRHGACIAAIPQPPQVPAPAPGTDLFEIKRPY